MKYTAQELFELLNDQDECPWIEAKGGHESSHSVMETVCAFCNEPGQDGGYILLGVAEDDSTIEPQYKVIPVEDPDKFQKDFSTQCASMFNMRVRPEISVEKINDQTVIKVWIDELPVRQKPLYFKTEGLPMGAFRRIGSTDQRCTDDDMHVFYQDTSSYDQTPVKGTSLKDIDEAALKRCRILREKVNPTAEELTYPDEELLQALGCVNKQNSDELNVSGLLLFGTNKIHRSTFPMLRVDYIRVPGNTWVQNPDDRFITIDMRGPLLLMVYRLIDAINADLPKGFLLSEGNPQATAVGLPLKALREAIVNALMHRSYREHRPTQVIRYDNRIEIINPGFSLKSEEKLGMPGSETRNPFIAAVFHDTNLAETKGSGIRAMQRLMQESHLAPPTFESSRENNEFTSRMLLHHFLDEADLQWLKVFEDYDLNDSQKQALLFVREVGAIDNHTYRQMADCDMVKASGDLRNLKNHNLLASKGKGKSTYYVAGEVLSTQVQGFSTPVPNLSTPTLNLSTPALNLSAPVPNLSTQPLSLSTRPPVLSTRPPTLSTQPPVFIIPADIMKDLNKLKKREQDVEKVAGIILKLCGLKALSADELARIFGKRSDYLRRKYLNKMIASKELKYLYPEMINHPEQAYVTNRVEDKRK